VVDAGIGGAVSGWAPEVILRGGSLDEFGVDVSFEGARALLRVRGEVDVLSAPELDAILDAVIEGGRRLVVLDLAELDFIGGAGLRVIAVGRNRLASSGGLLTIRSLSTNVRRLFDILGLMEAARLERPEADQNPLGPEQTSDAPGTPVSAQVPDLTQHLRGVTSVPADDDVVDGALRLVVALARATVSGADGVSVSLKRHGQLTTVAASDQTISDMDAGQYATGEGPCVDASVAGRWFHVKSLDHETRWPAFIPRAQELGINSILSTPLLSQDRSVGALNIYSRTAAAFESKDQELASVFATEASIILTDAGAAVSDEELTDRLQESLRTREIIAQAQGVVMEREGVSDKDAYVILRRSSHETDRPLRARAKDIVDSTRRAKPVSPVQAR
jgi:anti-anti-sigma factor